MKQVADSKVDSPDEAGDQEGAPARSKKKKTMTKKRRKAKDLIDEDEPSTHQDAGDENASPGKAKKKKKGKGKKAKKRQGSEQPSAQQDPSVPEDGSAGDDYWDEEDELEEYIMKRDLGQIREHSAANDRSDSSGAESEP